MRATSVSGHKGFTLIELLLVIGIIAILASIVIVSINPTKQLGDSRNAQRRSDVNTILNAVYQYSIDHEGSFPGDAPDVLDENIRMICSGPDTSCGIAPNTAINLYALTGAYVVSLPIDPVVPAGSAGTAYYISRFDGRVTVYAPNAEQNAVISVSR